MNTLKALVCDFDRSLAHDASGLRTRDALAQARRAGVRIIPLIVARYGDGEPPGAHQAHAPAAAP